jgi:uncharacterized lipoprotein YddW (UPF0748 family)
MSALPIAAVCLLAALQGSGEPAARGVPAPPKVVQRALWITRWDWRGERGLRETIARAADAGFDTLLFQVRGAASAFWRSDLEPRAQELDGEDPAFDPLAVALEVAHAHSVALHAWVNVVPAWWGTTPPRDTAHLYHRKPEWFWHDAEGRRQPLCERFYVSLNPCLPEVREYLVSVCAEIAARYPIDGLHLDYLRFPNEVPAVPKGETARWPRDPRTLALFHASSGAEPDAVPAEWDRWRAEQVTLLLRAIRSRVRAEKPELLLSAAVGPEAESAALHYQDWPRWLDEGLLDLVFPMNYTPDPERFEARLAAWAPRAARSRVVMGVMAGGQAELEVRASEIEHAREGGGAVAVFAYCSLWDSPNTVLESQDEAARAERAARRARLLPLLTR